MKKGINVSFGSGFVGAFPAAGQFVSTRESGARLYQMDLSNGMPLVEGKPFPGAAPAFGDKKDQGEGEKKDQGEEKSSKKGEARKEVKSDKPFPIGDSRNRFMPAVSEKFRKIR